MSITLLIILVTCIISIPAFSNHSTIDNLSFYPYRVWHYKEWHRLISCGFVHADGMHLFFNMFTLYMFGPSIERYFMGIYGSSGLILYVVMYFGAIAVADMYNLFTQKDNPGYRAVGASGGVAAVIFATILLTPYVKFFFGIPAVIYGPLYLGYCIYMAKRGKDNIGHIAHFSGSVFGFIFPILFEPRLLTRFLEILLRG